jgi:hypothetical protein
VAATPDKLTVFLDVHVVTEEILADAFTEWERRYREEPERFQSESERLAEEPEDYGHGAAPYLLAILAEQSAGRSS